MILGRNAGLWAALLQAFMNFVAAALVVATGQPVSPADVALFAAANGLGLAVIGIIANAADPSTVPTFALTTSAPPPTRTIPSQGSGSTGATGSAPSGASDVVPMAAGGTAPSAGGDTSAPPGPSAGP